MCIIFFFLNASTTTQIYTLSLHDALPISVQNQPAAFLRIQRSASQPARAMIPCVARDGSSAAELSGVIWNGDRKSTRLNSSHANISYAVFCLKKKKKKNKKRRTSRKTKMK